MARRREARARLLVMAVVFVVGVALLGPRANVSLQGPRPGLPEDPVLAADHIARREARVLDLRPGADARVVWADPEDPGRTEHAVVYLHGFSATRQETAPLSARVARGLSANLFEARLTGHGRPGEALGEATAEDWLRDAREAIGMGHRLGERVVVIACSTGGTLAALVAVLDRPEVAAYVLISPNFGPRDGTAELLLWPWAERWVPLVVGEEREWAPKSEAQARYWTTRYPVSALFEMMALVDRARAAPLSRIHAPVMVIHSDRDPVVDPAEVRAAFERLDGAARRARVLVDGEGDHHVVAGDVLAPQRTERLADQILEFVRAPTR